MLAEYYDNTIDGKWVTSESVYTAFQYEMNAVIDLTKQIFGKPLFREKLSLDNPPKELTFFFLPTKKNYNAFVLALDQMISENINQDFFVGKVALEPGNDADGKAVNRNGLSPPRVFDGLCGDLVGGYYQRKLHLAVVQSFWQKRGLNPAGTNGGDYDSRLAKLFAKRAGVAVNKGFCGRV